MKLGRPRLLIVGFGDVGARIVARFARRFRIVALMRSDTRNAFLRAAGAIPLKADLDDRQTLKRIAGLGARVIHLAPAGESGRKDRRTRNLVAAIGDRTQRAVYISTSGVYGDQGGRRIDETARLVPGSDRAWRRVDGEHVMRAAFFATVLRVPGIYAHDRLPLERLRQCLPALIPADDVFTNHVHADDLARIAVAAMLRGAPTRVINASDDSELKMGDYFDLVADRHGLPRPPRLPRAELAGQVSPMMLSFMRDSRRLSNRRLKRELRVRLLWPTVAAALNRVPPEAD
jgi:nucleoside-diphosphate-sugar epimerase